jgi:putative transposase
MPRLPRYAAPGLPQHVIQRGNNRTALFTDVRDHDVFSRYLLAAMDRHECLVHAYVFMSNHVHLLVTPHDAGGIGRLMQSLGCRYVRYFNERHGRTGTLWEGRYRATLVDSDRYLLTCYRYIELNPVRAGLVSHPAEYPWSSHGANAYGVPDPLVSPHARFLGLASNAAARCAEYQALFRFPIDPATLVVIRNATNTSWALGSESFCDLVGEKLNRRTGPLPAGRPRVRKRARA